MICSECGGEDVDCAECIARRRLEKEKRKMNERPKIICFLGSTKFKNHEMGCAQRETLRGHVVLMHGFFHHVDMVPISNAQKTMLDKLMMWKIEMADEVYIINVNGYVGDTTARGIEYAKKLGKTVRWLEEP